MLKALRENSRSFIIWILFGVIIAFFIISFGPQASQSQFTCAGRTPYVAKVGDVEIQESSWRYAMNAMGFGSGSGAAAQAAGEREIVMDRLIERELFAQAAEAAGFQFTDEFIDQKIVAGDIFILGQPLRLGDAPPDRRLYITPDGVFDYDILERWVTQRLGLSNVGEFREEQRRELLADAMRQMLIGSARVSPEEVLHRFEQENTTVAIDYVKFEPARYRVGMALTDAEIAAYLAAHEDEVKQKYEIDKRNYTAVKPEIRAHQIFVKRENVEPSDDPTLDPGHARAAAARARIEGGEDFAAVARELSEDSRTRARGGDTGWRKLETFSVKEVTDVAKTLEVGQLSEVIAGPTGFYVLRIDDKREGDLSYDQVKMEIAEKLALEAYARENALRDAEAALAKAQAGTPLAEQYPRPQESTPTDDEIPPGIELVPEDGGDDEPADGEDGDKTGARLIEGPNIPAQSPPAAEPAAAPARIEGDIPRPADLQPPTVESVGSLQRNGNIVAGPGMNPYVGNSAELANALFDELEAGTLAPRVFEVDDGYLVVFLESKKLPDMERFEEEKAQLNLSYAREKAFRSLTAWKDARCQAMVDGEDIAINREFVSYTDAEGATLPSAYRPCSAGAPGIELLQ